MRWNVLLGAAFLMATSAIGPGFLTQTALFTSQLGASFGFAILVSIILDVGAQLNIWRIIAVAKLPTQQIGNRVLPGAGTFIAILIALGGLAFNVGNVAGTGLGMNVMLGIDVRVGALLSGLLALSLFLVREAGRAMDRFAQTLGFVMIGLTVYVAATSAPPVGEAVLRSIVPQRIDALVIVTLVGGTVGGYITFAGAHRLLDAGVHGVEALPQVARAATSGILVTAVMRVLLFLAALGVVAKGLSIDTSNPPASVFRLAAGEAGYRMFGVVMWAAAVTSVVGASYTSASFVTTLHTRLANQRAVVMAFIVAATMLFLLIGRPVKTLVVVGALNALVLPIALLTLLIAAHRGEIVRNYRHPRWLTAYGAAVTLIMAALAIYVLIRTASQL
ncbi:MAG: NRAMP family divalent metal transporter [Gemmatimonadota bacterium]